MTFGRFNPPTVAHEKIFEYVSNYDSEYDKFVILSSSQNTSTNPISIELRYDIIRSKFPNLYDVGVAKDLFTCMRMLNIDYSHIVFVVGSDRVKEYKNKLNMYNGKEYNFDKIEVIQFGGDRNQNDISSTLARKYAKDGDFNSFCNISMNCMNIGEKYQFYSIINKL